MPSHYQLENLGITTRMSGNPYPPPPGGGSTAILPASHAAEGSSQHGTSLVQSNSSPVVSHVIGTPEEDSGILTGTLTMVYIGPKLP